MRKAIKHSRRVEIPHRRARHHVQSQGSEHGEIHGGVDLLHETVLLAPGPDSVPDRHGPDESLHQELTREGKNDDVECHEGEVESSFAIEDLAWFCMVRAEGVVGWKRIGEEEGIVDRIARTRVDEVEGDDKEHEEQW